VRGGGTLRCSYSGAYVRLDEAEDGVTAEPSQIAFNKDHDFYQRSASSAVANGAPNGSEMYLMHKHGSCPSACMWYFCFVSDGKRASPLPAQSECISGLRGKATLEQFGDPELDMDWYYSQQNDVNVAPGSVVVFNFARHVYASSLDEMNKESALELLDGTVRAPTTADLNDIMMTDKSGSPANFVVEQRRGHMVFSFVDASMCETEFSVTRQEVSADGGFLTKEAYKSIVPAYRAEAARMCGTLVAPEAAAGFTDNLLTSGVDGNRVTQGTWFRYVTGTLLPCFCPLSSLRGLLSYFCLSCVRLEENCAKTTCSWPCIVPLL
jgi:hypothetical protein